MSRVPADVDFLAAYPASLREEAAELRASGRLTEILAARYPDAHQVNDNAALHQYVMEMKRAYMRQSPPLSKVRYCDKMVTLQRALGTHTYVSRVQGKKLKSKNELRVSSLFKDTPLEFLSMIVAHELAHIRHKDHDKQFYRLCQHMEPDYFLYERDLRLWLYDRQGQR